jgi:hypothetical protein
MGYNLAYSDIQELKNQGYNDYEIQMALQELENETLGSGQPASRGFSGGMGLSNVSGFATKMNDDIIRWQLELNDILERADHILRGDIPTIENNEISWKENPNPDDNCLNKIGVQEIMKRLAMYVNRNTILADYTNEEIHLKVFDFTRELNNLIFMNYDKFGMDNEEKRKFYPMIIKEVEDIVNSSYKRALDGAEKRSLREMINVSQSSQTSAQLSGGQMLNQQGMPTRERGLLNPYRYVKGKYV